jgi:hypothetical protein
MVYGVLSHVSNMSHVSNISHDSNMGILWIRCIYFSYPHVARRSFWRSKDFLQEMLCGSLYLLHLSTVIVTVVVCVCVRERECVFESVCVCIYVYIYMRVCVCVGLKQNLVAKEDQKF